MQKSARRISVAIAFGGGISKSKFRRDTGVGGSSGRCARTGNSQTHGLDLSPHHGQQVESRYLKSMSLF